MKSFTIVAIAISGLIGPGCASHEPTMFARSNPNYTPAFTDKIALAERTVHSPELNELKRSVIDELARRGVNLVPPRSSDYVLSFWVEEGGIQMPPITVLQPYLPSSGYYYAPGSVYGGPGGQPYYGIGTMYVPVTVDRPPLPTKGIRLRLFVTRPKGTNLLETAWEGYIDGGPKMAPEAYDGLVQTLMGYWGRNYSGKIQPVEQGIEP